MFYYKFNTYLLFADKTKVRYNVFQSGYIKIIAHVIFNQRFKISIFSKYDEHIYVTSK